MSTITLSWTDRNEIELGHRVYRKTEPFGVDSLPLPLAELPENTTSYVDDVGATSDEHAIHYYIVSAFTEDKEAFGDLFTVNPIDSIDISAPDTLSYEFLPFQAPDMVKVTAYDPALLFPTGIEVTDYQPFFAPANLTYEWSTVV